MMSTLIHLGVMTAAVWLTAVLLPGVELKGRFSAFKVAMVLGVLNWLLGTFLFRLLVVGTLGIGWVLWLFTQWLVNAILLRLTDAFLDDFEIKTFGRTLVAAAMISAFANLGQWLLRLG